MPPEISQNNQVEQPQIPAHTSTPKNGVWLIVLVFLLSVLSTLAYSFAAAYYNSKNVKYTAVPQKNNVASPKCEIKTPYKNQTKIEVAGVQKIKDSDEARRLEILYKDDIDALLKDSGEKFEDYGWNVSKDGSMLAFVATKQESLGNEPLKALQTVYTYSFEEKELTKTYTQVHELVDSTMGKFSRVSKLLFSPSGKDLYIGTHSGVKVYSLDSGKISTLFENPESEEGAYSFSPIVSSPDEKYLVIGAGMYEGMYDLLYNFDTAELEKLGFTSYVGGKRVVDWYNDKMILSVSLWSKEDLSDGLYLVDPETLTPTGLLTLKSDGFIYETQLHGDYLFYTFNDDEVTDKFTCTNADTMFQITSKSVEIRMLNLKTKEEKVIFSLDTTNVYGVEDPPYDLVRYAVDKINGRDVLVISTKKHTGFYDTKEPLENYFIYAYDLADQTLKSVETK